MKFFLIISTIGLVLLSCISIPTENYVLEKQILNTKASTKTLKILIFDDLRSGENYDYTPLSLIPFFISAKATLNFPEADTFTIINPIKYYIADILKKELSNQYQFKKTYLSEDSSILEDFNLSGKIFKYTCYRSTSTYGLGAFGIITWYFGAPIFKNECEVNIEIISKNKAGSIILNKIYTENEVSYVGFYYNITSPAEVHPNLMKKLMKRILADFQEIIK
ncbi:hypothetical protein [Leptospira jelokensis]|uniref:hypothetical protein n=1 Tax=Leptospira jelokensis TaxID=2484931 RepID=UPI001090F186|nr:hypothetical protein [Leptospira jelokensis]TGM07018.1 hypothetical protein EHQ79_00140 [Leptospira jelokensis]